MEFTISIIDAMDRPLRAAWETILSACPERPRPSKGKVTLSQSDLAAINSRPGTRKGLRLFRTAYDKKCSERVSTRSPVTKLSSPKKASSAISKWSSESTPAVSGEKSND